MTMGRWMMERGKGALASAWKMQVVQDARQKEEGSEIGVGWLFLFRVGGRYRHALYSLPA